MADTPLLEDMLSSLCAVIEQSCHGWPVCSEHCQKGGAPAASVQGSTSILIWLPTDLCPARSDCISSNVAHARSSRHTATLERLLALADTDGMLTITRFFHVIGDNWERHEFS